MGGRGWGRRLGVMAGSGLLIAGLAIGPSTASAIRLVDYPGAGFGSNSFGAGSWGYGQNDDSNRSGGSGGQGGSAGSTVDSQAATTAESRGVALIDTELYDGSAAAGTGIVLTADGEILTNYHVVEGSTVIKVTIASTGKTYTAALVGADESSDVAVLQLQNASGLSTATMDDDAVAVGDDVTAVGNAGGTGTLTAADGDVTALNAQITTAAEGPVQSETLSKMIETDADVVAGDSGGPLLDSEGEVVGIDTAASSGSEIDGYAIPIDNALAIAEQIQSGDETDQVRIGPAAYLGVQVTDSTAAQDQYGDQYGSGFDGSLNGTSGPRTTTGAGGAAVAAVEDGTPAATAGLTSGDLITGVDSTTIGSASDLTEALADQQPGDTVRITWTDGTGAEQSATVTLGESPVN
ncbi:S1C family serine protease [Microlunatus soli]|uniref:Serine protease, S1-C subfamily, contains C-terminal PDZ domain n=1 Tax=Microlunatus soli TaxID=630515 RepID=A0A1H1ZA92_9ACTN|nr:trypsin-like peptidase domain-containing protein [Microlunatus soli]SDT30691.1 serine protease, S1-C subfamily, contains C-terminal PDZ domain [Microlunatus soli]